jgi:hypothetical protein
LDGAAARPDYRGDAAGLRLVLPGAGVGPAGLLTKGEPSPGWSVPTMIWPDLAGFLVALLAIVSASILKFPI